MWTVHHDELLGESRLVPARIVIFADLVMIEALHLSLWFIAFTVLSAPSHAAERGDRSQGRSMVITQGGIVASEHPLASAVGANILATGGNAIDAAVATNAMMGLVAPMMDGIGGDLFAIMYEAKTGKLYGLNASGWTPAKLTVDFMREQGAEKMPFDSIHAVTVPGVVAGWMRSSRVSANGSSPMRCLRRSHTLARDFR